MKNKVFFILFSLLLNSCANMVAPTGGDKDILPPKLVNIIVEKKQADGQLEKINFEFDEFIVMNNWEENFYISPPINKRIQKSVKGHNLALIVEDTLAENTTYYLSLSNCIKDLNEGNILDSLNYIFSTSDFIDTLTLSGQLKDAYTLEAIENAWIMLFEETRNDTIIFKEKPNYIAKTNTNGLFHFPNLNNEKYKMVALTDFDFIYNEAEQIAFLENAINAETDSFISIFAFDPIVELDSSTNNLADSIVAVDSSAMEEAHYGNLQIKRNSSLPTVFQLLQNDKIISEFVFIGPPYNLIELTPGKYQLKCILDANLDGKWNTGSWISKTQPEKVINYHSEITIRSNWDLEIEWNLD